MYYNKHLIGCLLVFWGGPDLEVVRYMHKLLNYPQVKTVYLVHASFYHL